MAESIQSVHVNFTATTKDLEAGLAKGQAASQRFKREFKETVRSAKTGGKSMAGSISPATKEMGKFGTQVAGAPAAISGMSNAMVAFGGKSTGAIGAIGGAISSMLASGFTPLGLAIGAATVAIGLFATRTDEALDSLKEKAKEGREELLKFGKDVDSLLRRRDAARAGIFISADEDERAQRLRDLLREQRQLAKSIKPIDFLKLTDPRKGTSSADDDERAAARRERAQQISYEIALLRAEEQAVRELKEAEDARKPTRITSISDETLAQFYEVSDRVLPAMTTEAELLASAMERAASAFDSPKADAQTIFNMTEARREQAEAEAEQIERELEERARKLEQMRGDGGRTFESIWEDSGILPNSKKLTDELSVMEAASLRLGETFVDSVGAGIADALLNAKDLGDVMQDIGRQVAATAIQFGVRAALGPAFGLTGFATGGSFMVGGSGGTDSQLVAFKASPNESVTIETPEQRGNRGGGGTIVQIVNTTGQPASQRTTRDSSGREVVQVAVGAGADDVVRGGKLAQAIERTYGLRRGGRQV